MQIINLQRQLACLIVLHFSCFTTSHANRAQIIYQDTLHAPDLLQERHIIISQIIIHALENSDNPCAMRKINLKNNLKFYTTKKRFFLFQ